MSLLFGCWNLSRIIFLLYLDGQIIIGDIIFLYLNLGNICLFLSFLFVANFLNNLYFGSVSNFLSKIGFLVYSGVVFLLTSDIVLEQHIVYTKVNNTVEIHFSFLLSLSVILGALSLIFSYIYAIRRLELLPDILYTPSKLYNYLIGVIGIMSIAVWFLFDRSVVQNVETFNSMISVIINLFYMLIFYYFYSQPFYQFNVGLSATSLVRKKFVGYFLGVNGDEGPKIVITSDKFNERAEISEITIDTLNVSSLTALALNSTFSEKIAIFPVANNPEYSTIVLSFLTNYKNVLDKRIRNSTIGIFGIIIPSVLLVSMNNLINVQNRINILTETLKETDDTIPSTQIEEVVILILNALTI